MQLTSLITAAGLAVSTTSAFLLPVTDISDNDHVTTLPVPSDTDFSIAVPEAAEMQKLELPCPGCPVPVGHHKGDHRKPPKMKTDIPSHLELAFSIDHAADHDRLMLNDFELYPRGMRLADTLGAQVLPDPMEEKHKDSKHKLPGHRKQHMPIVQPLGYAMSTSPVAQSTEDDLELVQIELQIIEVGNVFVDGVPSVEIKVIKTPEGGLMIGGIKTTESESLAKTPTDKQEECSTMLCRWKAMLSSSMGRFRPHCGGGRRPAHAAGQLEGHRGHSHGHGPHGQQHRHRFSHLLRNIVSHIILPVLVGIAAGITASIIGMLVGTAIVYVWRALFRRAGTRRHHRRGHSTHKAARKEDAADDEKAGLMSNQEQDADAPPAYVEEGLVNNDKPAEN